MHPHVDRIIIYNSQGMESNYLSTDKWLKKMWYPSIYICTIEYQPSKEQNPATSDNMDGPWGHYAKSDINTNTAPWEYM